VTSMRCMVSRDGRVRGMLCSSLWCHQNPELEGCNTNSPSVMSAHPRWATLTQALYFVMKFLKGVFGKSRSLPSVHPIPPNLWLALPTVLLCDKIIIWEGVRNEYRSSLLEFWFQAWLMDFLLLLFSVPDAMFLYNLKLWVCVVHWRSYQ